MRVTTGGIAIDTISCALTCMSIYGNEKFNEWGKAGVTVSRVESPGAEPIIWLKRNPRGTPTTSAVGRPSWTQPWSKKLPGDLIPKFGQTSPLSVHMPDADTIAVYMPAADKRAPLKRGRGKSKSADVKKSAPDELPESPEAPTTPGGFDDLHNALRRVNELRHRHNARLTVHEGDVVAIIELR